MITVLPFVILCETLPTAQLKCESIIYESVEEFQLLPRRHSVHDKPTIAVARPVLFYPVVVTMNGNQEIDMFSQVTFGSGSMTHNTSDTAASYVPLKRKLKISYKCLTQKVTSRRWSSTQTSSQYSRLLQTRLAR